MEGFQVGNKLVAMPGLSQEDIAKIEEQKAKEDAMLQGVTEETLQIALTPEQKEAITQVYTAIDNTVETAFLLRVWDTKHPRSASSMTKS